MANRVIRGDIIESESVNKLSWAGEVFYRRLMSVVDDFGLGDARPSILRSKLYPLKLDKVSDADIVKWLTECEKAGLISIYQVNDKDYLEYHKFNQSIRIKKSKYPPPSACIVQTSASHLQASASNCMSGVGDGVGLESRSEIGDGDGLPATPTYDYQNPVYPVTIEKVSARDCLMQSERFLNDQIAIDIICKNNFIDRDRIRALLKQFIDDKSVSSKVWDSDSDFRENFRQWLPIMLSKKPPESKTYSKTTDLTRNLLK